MLALGHLEEAGEIDPDHAQIHAALTAARVFRDDSKSFVNLSLYEQRLQRVLKESLRQLKELQAERKAARQTALDEAVALRNLHKMKGEAYHPTPSLTQVPSSFFRLPKSKPKPTANMAAPTPKKPENTATTSKSTVAIP